jgi:general stress protein YciG
MAGKSERGFAAMDPEQQREIARRGGRAAHESGNAHEFTSEEAAEAGRKGGEAVSRNREHMAEIGRKGGLAAHHRTAASQHDSTAQHHRQSARRRDAEGSEEGEQQSRQIKSQSEKAHGHSQKSRRASASQASEQKARQTAGSSIGQDHDLESDLSESDAERQQDLSRGESVEARTSGDEGEVDDDHLIGNEDSDIESGGGRSRRHSGQDEMHA